jgi:hypothetical protein
MDGATTTAVTRVETYLREPGALRAGAEILSQPFKETHYEDLRASLPAENERIWFTQSMMDPHRGVQIDFQAHHGVEWSDPMADRRLLERLLNYPLYAFRAGRRPRGLAREIARGLLPDCVRLRRRRGAQAPEQAAWFVSRAADYRALFRRLCCSHFCGQFLDFKVLGKVLEMLCTGAGSTAQAMMVHRALDVGLFALRYEHG